MQLYIFSVYDAAVKAYIQPFYARSKGEAVRTFVEAVNTKDHQFGRHALDYTLMYLGVYEDGDGSFDSCMPERLMSAAECLDNQIDNYKTINGSGGPEAQAGR